MKKIFCLLPLFFAIACNNKKPSGTQTNVSSSGIVNQPLTKAIGTQTPSDSLKPPVVKEAGTRIIFETDRVPPVTYPLTIGQSQGISNFTNYTTDQGLALDAIASGFKDSNGNLWFGTYGGGVSRYDGKSFTNFTTAQGLANNNVYSINQDSKGDLWFGTFGGGVSRYDGKTFTNFTKLQGLANNKVLSIAQDSKGNLWFGTYGGGVSRYDGKSFTNFTKLQGLANNGVLSITQDCKGDLWFGTAGGGVSRYDGKSFTNFTKLQGLANNNVRSITQGRNGDLWFGTAGGGVSRYDGKSFTNFTKLQGLANNNIRSITKDSKGNLWFGTEGGGVSRYDGKSFTNFTKLQGLANNNVYSITQDNKGCLWFGTYGGGLSRYDGNSFTNFTSDQGLANNTVFSITQDSKGDLWFGTAGGGVSRYDGKSFTNFTELQGLANNTVLSTTQDGKGNLWFGTAGGGVSRYDGKTFTNFTKLQGLANNSVWCITQDSKGDLWFGTEGGGVSRYDGKSFTNFTELQGLANNNVWCITQDGKGGLWFGTYGGGVSRYDGKSFTNITTDQGLANNTVYSITQDSKGNLWFGTAGGGLSRYDGNFFMNFTKLQGLPDDVITQVVITKQGITIGTNFGVGVLTNFTKVPSCGKVISPVNSLSNAELKNYMPVIEIYNSSTGYPIKDVNTGQNGMMVDNEGIIWVGTGNDKTGLVRFDYDALLHNDEPPKVVIQNVKLNNENICWYNQSKEYQVSGSITEKDNTKDGQKFAKDSLSAIHDSMALLLAQFNAFGKTVPQEILDSQRSKFSNIQFDGITRFYPLPEHLVLPYEYNNVSFDFNAIETGKPLLVNYQYILDGYDNEWSPITKKTSATFGNIYEGSYIFKLKAQSPEGVWCEPVEYTFKVLPPWWRTWWMYSIDAIIIFIFLFGIYRWRTAALRKDKAILEDKVEERTNQLYKEKNEVLQQKEIVEKQKEKIIDSITYAQRIQQSILMEESEIQFFLQESFIYFQPKDIVSGDFYWCSKIEDKIILAAIDCTGHGVPGAFMSMIGNTLMNQIVNEKHVTKPSEILRLLNLGVYEALHQKKEDTTSDDGMDVTLCTIDYQNNEVQYAGQNPLYVLSAGQIEVIKGNVHGIGGGGMIAQLFDPLKKEFTNHVVPIKKEMSIYLFSDGYVDQFGGSNRKKFGSQKFKELLLQGQHLGMQKQKELIASAHTEWKGITTQIDDILVIGVKL